jgi:hypothetical protein
MRLTNATLAFLILAVAIGCGTVNPGVIPGTKDDVLLPGTREYERRVQTFKVSPKELKRIVAEHTHRPAAQIPDPGCIVGRCYVSPWFAWRGIPLWGHYVNGDTGEWTDYSAEEVPYWVRFDFFGFARIVPKDFIASSLAEEHAADSDREHGEPPAPAGTIASVETDAVRGRTRLISIEPVINADVRTLMSNWVSGRPEHREIRLTFWALRIPKESYETANVFINTPEASVTTPTSNAGYVATLDFEDRSRESQKLRWFMSASVALRKLVRSGKVKPDDQIVIQIVPILRRNEIDRPITLGAATLSVDEER